MAIGRQGKGDTELDTAESDSGLSLFYDYDACEECGPCQVYFYAYHGQGGAAHGVPEKSQTLIGGGRWR